jgi:phosphatidylglycerol:prolipoprotein diacylglycerol transferase
MMIITQIAAGCCPNYWWVSPARLSCWQLPVNLGYDLGVMAPELGQIGPFVIRTYTLLLDLGILIGLGILTWQGWRIDDKPVEWVDAGLGALVGGFILGRAGHVAIHWTYFAEHADEIARLWRGGIDWHGAVVGGLIGLGVVCLVRRLIFRQVTDTLAFVLPLGATIVYAACLSTSCGHGREVRTLADYPSFMVAELPDLYGVTAPRLASQLYGVALGVLLLGIAALLSRLIRRRGVRLWPVLALLGVGAFGIGYTRGDAVLMVGTLRLDQILDLAVAGIGLAGTLIAAWPRRCRAASRATEPAEAS